VVSLASLLEQSFQFYGPDLPLIWHYLCSSYFANYRPYRPNRANLDLFYLIDKLYCLQWLPVYACKTFDRLASMEGVALCRQSQSWTRLQSVNYYFPHHHHSPSLMFNVAGTQSVTDHNLFIALRPCWTVPSCRKWHLVIWQFCLFPSVGLLGCPSWRQLFIMLIHSSPWC